MGNDMTTAKRLSDWIHSLKRESQEWPMYDNNRNGAKRYTEQRLAVFDLANSLKYGSYEFKIAELVFSTYEEFESFIIKMAPAHAYLRTKEDEKGRKAADMATNLRLNLEDLAHEKGIKLPEKTSDEKLNHWLQELGEFFTVKRDSFPIRSSEWMRYNSANSMTTYFKEKSDRKLALNLFPARNDLQMFIETTLSRTDSDGKINTSIRESLSKSLIKHQKRRAISNPRSWIENLSLPIRAEGLAL